MEQDKPRDLEQLRAFLAGSQEIRFAARNRKETDTWVRQTLVELQYHVLRKPERGLVKSYLAKVTGTSRAQLTRLIGQYVTTGQVEEKRYRRRRFPSQYTRTEIELLAEVDEAHETFSGPATQKILYRGVSRM